MNAFLYQAYDQLTLQERHSVDLKTLGALVGFDSNNMAHLKDAITELTQTSIKWDVVGSKKGSSWKISTLLAAAKIEDGVCTYEYSSMLRDELYDPDKWTRINLAIQRKFTSAYALILYENCVRFRTLRTTGQWKIDDFRKLLGVDDMPSYSAFRVLNDKIIKPAVKEVNRHSDIIIKPYFTKNGRKIATIRFTIQDNNQTTLFNVEEADDIMQSPAYKELRDRGMSKVFSRKAVLDFGEDYIFEQLGIADQYASQNSDIESKQGLIRQAISEGYSKPEIMVKAERRQEAEKQKKRQATIQSKIEALEKDKKKIEREYREMFTEMVQSVFEVYPPEDQSEIRSMFTEKYPLSAVTARDFQANGWQSLLNWPNIKEFWMNDQQLPCPTLEQFSSERGLPKILEKLEKLEADLAK